MLFLCFYSAPENRGYDYGNTNISKWFHLGPSALLSQPNGHLFSWSTFPQPILVPRAALSETELIESQKSQGQVYTTVR